MVKVEQKEQYQFSSAKFHEKGYIEVVKEGRTYRFTVLDDGGAGEALTSKKIQNLISRLIDSEKLALSSHVSSREITVEKESCKIKGLHAPIVLKMTRVSPYLHAIITFIREKILGPLFGLQSTLTKHITKEFRLVVEKLPLRIQKKILKDLRITPAEHYSLKYFGAIIKDYPDHKKINFVKEVLNGAYVQIEDNGAFYDEWVNDAALEKRTRTSSHVSSDNQYSFQGPLFNECLFSKKKLLDKHGNVRLDKNGKEREATWFQLERYPAKSIYALPHLITWVLYKLTGQNQGPHGASHHTEHKSPIILKLPK